MGSLVKASSTSIQNVSLFEDFLTASEADQLFELCQALPFEQRSVFVAGALRPQPRLVCLLGQRGLKYSYSGLTLGTLPFPKEILRLIQRIESATGAGFNVCLVNYYRDGNDSIGMHRDNEPEMGPDPVVASVSLGGTRTLSMKSVFGGKRAAMPLHHGSLLVMGAGVQQHWLHGIEKEPGAAARINLTFRQILRDKPAASSKPSARTPAPADITAAVASPVPKEAARPQPAEAAAAMPPSRKSSKDLLGGTAAAPAAAGLIVVDGHQIEARPELLALAPTSAQKPALPKVASRMYQEVIALSTVAPAAHEHPVDGFLPTGYVPPRQQQPVIDPPLVACMLATLESSLTVRPVEEYRNDAGEKLPNPMDPIGRFFSTD